MSHTQDRRLTLLPVSQSTASLLKAARLALAPPERSACFTADVFSSFWHFGALYLRVPSADRSKTFTGDWKCVHLDNVGPHVWDRLPEHKIWGQLP